MSQRDRRLEVSEAAWRVIVREGLDRTSMRAIAQELGCTTGVVTHHFRDKQELMLFALNRLTQRLLDAMQATAERTRGIDRLAAVLFAFLPLDAERQDILKIWLAFLGYAVGREFLMAEHQRCAARLREVIARELQDLQAAKLVRADLDVALEANALLALVNGIGLDFLIQAQRLSPIDSGWRSDATSMHCYLSLTIRVAAKAIAGKLAIEREEFLMVQTIGVTKAIANLNDVRAAFGLNASDDPSFFPEWLPPLPELSAEDRTVCDRLRHRYRHYQATGSITESTVNLIIVAPILELLGWCDPPYLMRGEKYVKIEIEDGDRVLEGLIDILVVRDRLWLVVLESKRYGFSAMQALPQTLAYMMANPGRDGISYGLITTGEDYLFAKLDERRRLYDISDKFTLSTRHGNQLFRVVEVLKKLVRG